MTKEQRALVNAMVTNLEAEFGEEGTHRHKSGGVCFGQVHIDLSDSGEVQLTIPIGVRPDMVLRVGKALASVSGWVIADREVFYRWKDGEGLQSDENGEAIYFGSHAYLIHAIDTIKMRFAEVWSDNEALVSHLNKRGGEK